MVEGSPGPRLMLGRRRRRCPNITPALGQYIVLSGLSGLPRPGGGGGLSPTWPLLAMPRSGHYAPSVNHPVAEWVM